MPNRGIKESICSSETLSQISAEAERLFYRLIVNCDDFGRMDARPEIVRSKCFPLITDKLPIPLIESWLSELAVDLIILYTNNGKRYLQFVNWDKHNRVRASESKYPSCDDDGSELLTPAVNCQQVQTKENKSGRTRTSTSTRDKNKRHGDIDCDFSSYTENAELSDALKSFLIMRKAKKKPTTDTAISLLLNELNKLADNDTKKIAIVNQSIMNGWQGFFPLKEQQTTPTSLSAWPPKKSEPAPDPGCLICKGVGKIPYVTENDGKKQTILQTCECVKKKAV